MCGDQSRTQASELRNLISQVGLVEVSEFCRSTRRVGRRSFHALQKRLKPHESGQALCRNTDPVAHEAMILAYSPQAKGRIERSFLPEQDRLVKHLRLAKISTMEGANAFLESEYWPEWNAHFARPVAEFPNQHRGLTAQLDLAAILCHVEERVIGNDYTFSFAGRRYQIARAQVQVGMRRQHVRLELHIDGELKAGGGSSWMQGFFDRPSPPLWKLMES